MPTLSSKIISFGVLTMSLCVKCLNKHNQIVMATSPVNQKYFDITRKLQIIKSYRLQFMRLGYIANDGQISGRNALFNIVNTQINKSLSYYKISFCRTNLHNALNLVCKCLLNHTSSRYIKQIFDTAQVDPFSSIPNGFSEPYLVLFKRLLRKASKKGINLTIDKLYNQAV